ncbi:hypothetical protein [Saccharothrix syringae]|uniref:Uncharacterized protein n=1 Tax=Saccharothrix syringae TaxID=103733 RepID=A0A5Q0H3P2_SACSY|nr:hypothetical protein [Saccharothrix syringae]QFZ20430.1 hypothetical protein EKG83_26115 [Saccharothrix syringae]
MIISPDVPAELQQQLQRPPRWRATAPAELPRVRRDVRDHLMTSQFIAKTIEKYHHQVATTDPLWFREAPQRDDQLDLDVLRMLDFEADLLGGAPLYQVDPDMTLMALNLAADTPATRLEADYLPSQSGFALFEEPIGGFRMRLVDKLGYRTAQRPIWLDPAATWPVPIVGASWARGVLDGNDSLRVSFYTPQPENLWARLPPDTVVAVNRDNGRTTTAGSQARAMQRELQAEQCAELVWYGQSTVKIGKPLRSPTLPLYAQPWLQTLYALFQLHSLGPTTDALGETDLVHVPTSERKRDRRAGIHDTGHVHVVRLRSRHRTQPAHPANPGRLWGPLEHRHLVGQYRQNKCLDTHKHQQGTCRHHKDHPVQGHFKGPQGAPIRWRVNWLTSQGRHHPLTVR